MEHKDPLEQHWAVIKDKGSKHYKGNDLEPIDLYRSRGTLWLFSLVSIEKYAFRNETGPTEKTVNDMDKIIHYAEMVKFLVREMRGEETNEEPKT